MHPNDLGQVMIADAIEDAMDFLRHPQVVTVTPWATPIAGVPVTLTVQVTDGGGHGVPGAPVWAGGNWFGTTDTTGAVTATTTFASAGAGIVTANGDPFPAGTATISVAGAAYNVTSSPNPLPLNKQLTNVVLDATDGAGQRVAGTFTLHHGGGTVSRNAGQPIASIKIKPLVHYELDENGKPYPMYECPTIDFTPFSNAFTATDSSFLIDC